MIVKVQRALMPHEQPAGHPAVIEAMENAGIRDGTQIPGYETQALIYNQARTVKEEVPFSEVEAYFNGDEMKIFCEAKLRNGHYKLLRRVGARNW